MTVLALCLCGFSLAGIAVGSVTLKEVVFWGLLIPFGSLGLGLCSAIAAVGVWKMKRWAYQALMLWSAISLSEL